MSGTRNPPKLECETTVTILFQTKVWNLVIISLSFVYIIETRMGSSGSKSKTRTIYFPTREHGEADLHKPASKPKSRDSGPRIPPRSSSIPCHSQSKHQIHSNRRESVSEHHSATEYFEEQANFTSCRRNLVSDAEDTKHAARAQRGQYPKGTCDKCDGAHLTDSCPIYKKKRDDHPDAWRNFGRKNPLEMGKEG